MGAGAVARVVVMVNWCLDLIRVSRSKHQNGSGNKFSLF